MDYEKKYNNALDRAKLAIEDCGDNQGRKNMIYGIFPELVESEDERIRKHLITHFQKKTKGEWNGMPVKNILAYLEKQKDVETEIEKAYKNADKIQYKKGFEDGVASVKQKEQKPAESISQLTVQGEGVYKICPRCKEHMVRDDSKVYTSIPPQYGYKCPKCGAMEFDTVMYDSPEMEEQKLEEPSDAELEKHQNELYDFKVFAAKQAREHHISFVHDFQWNNFCEELLSYFNEKQKPAEWSEEDEDNFKWFDKLFRAESIVIGGRDIPQDKYLWFKSLRPQPQWKPSEEQMNSLMRTITWLVEKGNHTDSSILADLRRELQKLM